METRAKVGKSKARKKKVKHESKVAKDKKRNQKLKHEIKAYLSIHKGELSSLN